jgi:ABC-type multidrug transport system permease subunit
MLVIFHHPYHLISLLVPLFVSLIFLVLFPSVNGGETIEVFIYDQGRSQLPTALEALPELSVVVTSSETAVFAALNEEATVGLVIPAGFDTAVANNQSPELTVYLNSEARSSSVAEAQRLLVETIGALRDPQPAAAIIWTERQPGAAYLTPFSLEDFLFTNMALLSMAVVGISLLPQLLHKEQEQGAFQALIATPVTLIDSVVGKLIAATLLTWLVVGIISVVHDGWRGNTAVTAVALLLGSLFVLGTGALMGLSLNIKSRGKAVGSVLVLLLSMPSWFATAPLSTLPDAAVIFLRLIPTHYFVMTLNHSLADQSWQAAGSSLIILALCTVAVYLLVGWRLSHHHRVRI